ncbi:VCBS repeat-containing protein [Chitinophaga lutea]|uniref:VCBS repeat-containing protein n=1 Tax=Chitinophaga lutea TaxID=2488634 RepID=A0A3N4Q7H0_9BACT|nr:VCBS repeat-containing protein [Chitinophaga lutea]RPE12017.1 VCBS repeat-containing protein [Chitinophaga lutea]
MKITKHTRMSLTIVRLIFFLALAGCAERRSDGEAAARKYCAACHAFPAPALLPKAVWKNSVLPAMGAFADIYTDRSGEYKMLPPQLAHLRDPVIAGVRTAIPLDEWKKIVAWYLRQAPDQLPEPSPEKVRPAAGFALRLPDKRATSFTACIYFDEAAQILFQSDIHSGVLRIFDPQLQQADSLLHTSVADVAPLGEGRYLLTNIGQINPGGLNRNGSVEEIVIRQRKIVSRRLLCDSLYRPVQALKMPEGLFVCEFGFMEGMLSVFTAAGKKTIAAIPGAIRMYAEDVNHDGRTDIVAMFAQGKECITAFINEGNGRFRQQDLLTFPPSYGSSYFQLADMDADGRKDIVYTCGDNADQSPVFKPYHGVYVFRNTGAGYRQVYFRHLDGCYRAIPADLNCDGQTDLAVISFFADFERKPVQALVYLLQRQAWQFDVYADEQVAAMGRWVCMDVKDVNGDGRPDILAGNMAAKPGNNTLLMNRWLQGPEFIIWENRF